MEDRTLEFSKRISCLCRSLPKDEVNIVYIKQLLRSGTSVGANYIEANEALSKKDFRHRMRIARKEAKETSYWLKLIIDANFTFTQRVEPLLRESKEIRNILSSIINKTS